MSKFVTTIGVIAISLCVFGNAQADPINKELVESHEKLFQPNNRGNVDCMVRLRGAVNTIEYCHIPDDQILGAMSYLMMGRLPWGFKYCSPPVLGEERSCTYNQYSLRFLW